MLLPLNARMNIISGADSLRLTNMNTWRIMPMRCGHASLQRTRPKGFKGDSREHF
mgnify:CR=1 FL=1